MRERARLLLFIPCCYTYPERLILASFTGDWYRVSSQNDVTCLLSWFRLRLTAGVENFGHYRFFWRRHISFRRPTNAIHVIFPLSLVYLKTQLNPLFTKSTQWCIPKTRKQRFAHSIKTPTSSLWHWSLEIY